jgi:hypothetical protein
MGSWDISAFHVSDRRFNASVSDGFCSHRNFHDAFHLPFSIFYFPVSIF